MSLDHDSIQDKIHIEKVTDVKYWGDTSNPSEHDPRKFRHLTYSTSEYAKLNMTLPRFEAGGKIIDVDMFLNPDDLEKKEILNMSLIDQDNTATFYSAGYLVRVPNENIRKICSIDAGMASTDEEILENALGEELLEDSVPGWYNEVVADIKSDSGIIDFFTYDSQVQFCDYPLTSTEFQEILSQAEDTMSVEEYQQLTDVFGDEELKAKIDKRAQNIYRARMKQVRINGRNC
jgi:hypothetical protein